MLSLLAASLIWAFSFGLIKTRLTGVDPALTACVRLVLATLVFAPWLRRAGVTRGPVPLAALGALQFGLMYVLYIAAYAHLPAWAVALFTVFTPLYVVLLDDVRRRRLVPRHLGAAGLAVAGGALVVWRDLPAAEAWPGILLLQGANLCFAAGQLVYRDWRRADGGDAGDGRDRVNLAWMYLGAAILAGAVAGGRGALGGVAELDGGARLTLLYLGVLPTGAAFWLWNRGAARVEAAVLGAANNLKIPLAVIVSWAVFGESARVWPAVGGLVAVIAALVLADRGRAPAPAAGGR